MTDNEIVKALEICDIGSCCDECAYRNYSRCNEMLAHDALGIIDRQNAEIEELRKYKHDYYVLKSKAIKEFAENVKDIVDEPALIRGRVVDVIIEKIDNLVKEMTEGGE